MRPTNVENRRRPHTLSNHERRDHYVAKHNRAAWINQFPEASTISDWLYREGEFAGHWETLHGQPIDDSQIGLDGIPNDPNAIWFDHPATVGMMDVPVIKSLFDGLEQYGALTEKQTLLARRLLANARNKATPVGNTPSSQWVGKIKERRKWELTVDKILSYEGNYGISYISMMHDKDGNTIVGKGTKRFGTEGNTITVVATVIDHTTRNGVKQTIINRPKIV